MHRHPGKVIWFTGLSGAGKSTLANGLAATLHAQQRRSIILDGDQLRRGLNSDLGFSTAERIESMRRTMEVAKLMLDAGLVVLVALIAPFRRERELARARIGAENFLEVYVSTSLAICEQRDTKGLYASARSGKLTDMTGIDSAFEVPLAPDVNLDCGTLSLQAAVTALQAALTNTHQ
jgi:bifunctional enzyme CysN/CysC